jgi:hypothetical protein
LTTIQRVGANSKPAIAAVGAPGATENKNPQGTDADSKSMMDKHGTGTAGSGAMGAGGARSGTGEGAGGAAGTGNGGTGGAASVNGGGAGGAAAAGGGSGK